MANILRYSPADDTFDDLFRGFFMRPVTFEGPQVNQLKIDVSEDEKAYTVHAEIPGVKKEEISVTIDGNLVAISAEIKTRKKSRRAKKYSAANAITEKSRARSRWRRKSTKARRKPNTATACWNCICQSKRFRRARACRSNSSVANAFNMPRRPPLAGRGAQRHGGHGEKQQQAFLRATRPLYLTRCPPAVKMTECLFH